MAVNLQDLIDIDLLAYFKSKLDLIFNTKVDKVAGKGLSTNDFTVAYKTKLDNIENNAQENDIEVIRANGANLTINNKIVDIPLASDVQAGLMSPSDKEKLTNTRSIDTTAAGYGKVVYYDTPYDVYDYPRNIAWFDLALNQYDNLTYIPWDLYGPFKTIYLDTQRHPVIRLSLGNSGYHLIDHLPEILYLPLTDDIVTGKTEYTDLDIHHLIFSAVFGSYEYKLDISLVDGPEGSPPPAATFTRTEFAQRQYVDSKFVYYEVAIDEVIDEDYYTLDFLHAEFPSVADLHLLATNGQHPVFVLGETDDRPTAYLPLLGFIYYYDENQAQYYASGVYFGCQDAIDSSKFLKITYDNVRQRYTLRASYFVDYLEYSDLCDIVDAKADAADVYTKTEIDQMLITTMTYKGTKATVSELPASGNHSGDVWHITADGSERAWNGSTWEELGTAIDLSGYVEDTDIGLATNQDIDNMFTPYVSEP